MLNADTFHPLVEWIQNYPHWAGFIVFIITVAECLVGIGFFVPGVLLMTTIGALVGTGVLPLGSTFFWAVLGAVVGDNISFWIGYAYRERVRSMWPFKYFPSWLNRGQQFFNIHGGKSILIGRFVGPVRPIIPVVAGMVGMSNTRFFVYNLLSGIVWAPLYCLPGYLFGIAAGMFDAQIGRRLVVVLLICSLVLWIGYTIYAFISKHARRFFHWCVSKTLHPGTQGLITHKTLALGTWGIFVTVLWIALAFGVGRDPDISWFNFSRAVQTFDLAFVFLPLQNLAHPLLLSILAVANIFWASRLYQVRTRYLALLAGVLALQFIFNYTLAGVDHQPWMNLLVAAFLYGSAFHFFFGHSPQALLGQRLVIVSIVISVLYFGSLPLLSTLLGLWVGVGLGHFAVPRGHTLPSWTTRASYELTIFVLFLFSSYWVLKHPMIPTESPSEWPVAYTQTTETSCERENFWGRPVCDLNVRYTGKTAFFKYLENTGWVELPPTTRLLMLYWLSDNPDPKVHPEIPSFHRHELPDLVYVKPTASGRLRIHFWRTETPNVWVGQVVSESLTRILGTFRWYLPQYYLDQEDLKAQFGGFKGTEKYLPMKDAEFPVQLLLKDNGTSA